jgi:hypothetical protein
VGVRCGGGEGGGRYWPAKCAESHSLNLVRTPMLQAFLWEKKNRKTMYKSRGTVRGTVGALLGELSGTVG